MTNSKTNKDLTPFEATPPAEVIREEMKARKMKTKDLAALMGILPNNLSRLLSGNGQITTSIANKLEDALDIPASYWLSLQAQYMRDAEAIAKRDVEEQEAKAFEQACKTCFNLQLLYKKIGFSSLSCMERVKRIKELFPFDLLSSAQLRMQVSGLYKHSEKVQIDDRNMQTWLLLNWLTLTAAHVTYDYVKGNGLSAATQIAKMANDRTLTVKRIKDCLETHGIIYVNVDKLDKVPVDAFSTFIDMHPAVSVTYRYDDMDKLAFDILHELCHIERHISDKTKAFISLEGTLYSNDPREKEANEFARQQLIPEETWRVILRAGSTSLSPHIVVKKLAVEAQKRGISPSIAISRYKHDTNWYNTSSFRSPKIH